MQAFKVKVPAKLGAVNSEGLPGAHFLTIPKFILIIKTDEGIEGFGETFRGVREDVVRGTAELLKGKDPISICWQSLPIELREDKVAPPSLKLKKYFRQYEKSIEESNPAYIGFETAILDIIGKALSVPVYTLLGGAFRKKTPINYWISQMTPEDSKKNAEKAKKLGFKGIKIKCQLEEPIVERIEAMIEGAGPNFRIVVDPNERFYRISESLPVIRQIAKYNIILEDPIPKFDFSSYKLLRSKTDIPIAVHLNNLSEIIKAVKYEAADYVNLTLGATNFIKGSEIAATAGMLCWHGSGIDLGILDAAYLHAAASAKGCILPSDIIGSYVREDDLIVEPIKYEEGNALVPELPGLGIKLDMDAMERYIISSFHT